MSEYGTLGFWLVTYKSSFNPTSLVWCDKNRIVILVFESSSRVTKVMPVKQTVYIWFWQNSANVKTIISQTPAIPWEDMKQCHYGAETKFIIMPQAESP